MKKKLHALTAVALSVLALTLAGCIVSGTFITDILIKDLQFNTQEGFYWEQVDLTEDETWDEHQDDIKSIDLVGFELWIQNQTQSDQTFEAYVANVDDPVYSTAAEVRANATLVIDELTLETGNNGDNYVSYPQSFGYVTNLETLKSLVESGQLTAYGLTTGGSFHLDSLRVIVTFTAGQ